MINWTKIIELYKKNLLIDLEKLLLIPLVRDFETASPEALFGQDIIEIIEQINLLFEIYFLQDFPLWEKCLKQFQELGIFESKTVRGTVLA